MIRYDGFEHLLRDKADHMPDMTALVCEKDGNTVNMSFFQFRKEVLDRAAFWENSGKTCLGILCDGSLECVLTVFASVIAGLQTVMLDENASDELLQEQIRYTDTDVLWGDEELVSSLNPFLTDGIPPAASEAGSGCPDSSDTKKNRPGKGNILFFTSGTTSQVKAVTLTDASLMSSAYNGSCMLPLHSSDRLMCMLPLNHVFGFVCSLLWGLSCGASVALGRGPRHYLDDMSFFHPTAVSAVPMLLGFLLNMNAFNEELDLILVGAGDCPEEMLKGVQNKGIRVSFGYGLTETSSGVAISTSGDPFAMDICPDDTITIAPDQEILIQSPTCMMKGYYKHPEDTAEVLKEGVLYTGDLGMIDDQGKLYIIGRKKEMLVLSDGTKIFLPEYEAQLSLVLEGRDFAVVEKDCAPVLVIRGDESEKKQIQKQLKGIMSRRSRGQQLRDIILIGTPMPRTTTGKIKRWELMEMIRHL